MSIILLQGPSGAGKTTIGKRLSADLDVPYIGKDTIKEMLFDQIGYPETCEVNYAYGRIAMNTIFNIVKESSILGNDIIVDCAFYTKEASANLDDYGIDTPNVMQIYFYAKPEVLMARFNQRTIAGDRHPGHGDTLKDSVGVFAEYIKIINHYQSTGPFTSTLHCLMSQSMSNYAMRSLNFYVRVYSIL